MYKLGFMSSTLPAFSINGQIGAQLSPLDRGFTYGDGLFETIKLTRGRALLWDWHWQRLREGCQQLNIALDEQQVLMFAQQLIETTVPDADAILKVMVTRGQGTRGYTYSSAQEPTVVCGIFPAPDYPKSYQQDGIALYLCELRLGLNPALAGLKILNKLEYVLARAEWSDERYAEGLLLDIDDRVIEGTVSNVFAVTDGALVTPVLDRCGVKGVMRRLVIERLAPALKLPLYEKALSLGDLLSADELFVSNSVFGLWPVNCLGDTPVKRGPIVTQLQQALMAELDTLHPQGWPI